MSGKILSVAQVSYNDTNEFMADLKQRIESLQNEGLEVEVQYQVCDRLYTALLIGRNSKEGS